MNSFLSLIWARRLVALLLGLIFLAPTTSTFARGGGKGGPVSVNGYFRSNGTYVAPHMRSAPDGNFSNNWSAVGNINPYTGEEGKKTTPANIGDSRTGGPIGPSPVGLSPADNPSNDQITSVPPSVEGPPTASQGLPNNQTNISPPNQLKTYTTSLSPNAELDYTGRSWQCRRGYFPRESECDVDKDNIAYDMNVKDQCPMLPISVDFRALRNSNQAWCNTGGC